MTKKDKSNEVLYNIKKLTIVKKNPCIYGILWYYSS